MNEKRIPVSPVTLEQAVAMLPEGEYIHTFIQAVGPGLMLIGANMKRETILKHFAEDGVELSGKMATAMKHGLAYFDGDKPVFVATREGGTVLAEIKANTEAAIQAQTEGEEKLILYPQEFILDQSRGKKKREGT